MPCLSDKAIRRHTPHATREVYYAEGVNWPYYYSTPPLLQAVHPRMLRFPRAPQCAHAHAAPHAACSASSASGETFRAGRSTGRHSSVLAQRLSLQPPLATAGRHSSVLAQLAVADHCDDGGGRRQQAAAAAGQQRESSEQGRGHARHLILSMQSNRSPFFVFVDGFLHT